LGTVRGLQFLSAETPTDVDKLIAEVLVRANAAPVCESTDLMEAVEDEQLFLEALTRRLAVRSLLGDIEFDFAPAAEQTAANVGAERLDDIVTGLIEGMAGLGVRHVRIATEVLAGQVIIRLSSHEPITPVALGKRRLDLHNRTLGWLGGSLECNQHGASSEFVIKVPVSVSA
jgi:hypothetical protein